MRPESLPGGRTAVFLTAGALLCASSALAKGRFIAPVSGDALTPGTTVETRWVSPCGSRPEIDEVELVLSLDGGATFPVRLTAQMPRCATGFSWRVPALPTAHARLALRAGSGGGSETEKLESIGAEFTILAAPGDGREELLRGASEWWTRQALTDFAAQDLLAETVKGDPKRLLRFEDAPDVSDPSPSPVISPDLAVSRLSDGGCRPSRPPARPRGPQSAAPIPLRE